MVFIFFSEVYISTASRSHQSLNKVKILWTQGNSHVEHTNLHHLWIKSSSTRAQLSPCLLKLSNWPGLDRLSALVWRALFSQDCKSHQVYLRKFANTKGKKHQFSGFHPALFMIGFWPLLVTVFTVFWKEATTVTGNFESDIFYFWINWLQDASAPMLMNSKLQWLDWIFPGAWQSSLPPSCCLHVFPSFKTAHFWKWK